MTTLGFDLNLKACLMTISLSEMGIQLPSECLLLPKQFCRLSLLFLGTGQGNVPNIHQAGECIAGRGSDIVMIREHNSLLRTQ